MWIAEILNGFETGNLKIATANFIIWMKQSASVAVLASSILIHSLIGAQTDRIWRHIVKKFSSPNKLWTSRFEIRLGYSNKIY